MLPDSIGLNVTRIEAWSDGNRWADPMESEFFLSIPNLPDALSASRGLSP